MSHVMSYLYFLGVYEGFYIFYQDSKRGWVQQNNIILLRFEHVIVFSFLDVIT